MLKRGSDKDESVAAAKRVCQEKLSCVLHVRNVSSDVTEQEVANLAIPFGFIKYLVLTRKSGQALIELTNERTSKSMVEFYETHPAQFYGRNVIIQYSRYESLSGKGMHPDAELAVKRANEEVEKLCDADPKVVLHVSVENWNENYRVGHLMLYKLFQRYGKVNRIIVFIQNPTPQALVELDSEISAHVSKLQLGGTPCFYGHNMRIEFSNRKSLDIKHESETGRDYTISPVSKDELHNVNNPYQYNRQAMNTGLITQINEPMMMRNQQYSNSNDTYSIIAPLLQNIMSNPDQAMHHLQNFAPQLSHILNNGNGSQSPGMMQSQYNQSQGHGMSMNSYKEERRSMSGNHFPMNVTNISSVLIVDHLNEEKVTPDALFTLFGCYGDVLRVKILYNKKETALVQFVDADQAGRALENLQGVVLFGRQIKVNFSKHQNISMPKPDEQNSLHLNRDYSNSRLHRFKRVTSRTLQNIYAPGPVLHVAGIPDHMANDRDIKGLFEDVAGFTVLKTKIITSNDKKMALVQFQNVEEAIEALIVMHDHNVGNTSLRVSFSKGFISGY